jgi:hypothetical protein
MQMEFFLPALALAAADVSAARTFAGAKAQGLKPKNADPHRHG